MKKLTAAFAVVLAVFAVEAWAQITVYYQPTPYPLYKYGGSPMPQDLNIVHLWDGWLPSVYYGKVYMRDNRLQIGGWGDEYRMYMKFDLAGLPSSVSQASLGLYSYPRGDSSTLTGFDVWKPVSDWNLSLTWDTQATGFTFMSSWNPGSVNSWWFFDITSLYNGWSGSNYGMTIMPWLKNNNFDMWRSSRYADFVADPYADGKRPILAMTFVPTLQLKMPLPGAHSWLVTTEVGGYDCWANEPLLWPDTAHQGNNYFSIDFGWGNIADNGATVYTESSVIPVLAAAGGTVNIFPNDQFNGNYAVITHGTTGFTSRYLHLADFAVSNNSSVVQGQVIGYMGSTGQGITGKHLHFGVRYNNSGASNIPELAKVVMDGWILKSFQTECALNANGWPTGVIRYYHSGNTVY